MTNYLTTILPTPEEAADEQAAQLHTDGCPASCDLKQAAFYSGFSYQHLWREAAQTGNLRAQKVSGAWRVSRMNLARYLAGING